MWETNLYHTHFRIVTFLLVIIGLVGASLLSLPVVALETMNLSPIADSYIYSNEPTTNNGAGASLLVSFGDYEYIEDNRRNVYLLFDLTSVDIEHFDIISATLELYTLLDSSPTFQVGVHSCPDTEWNEIEITWENAPAFSSEPLDVETIAFGDMYYSWDVTDEVKNAQENYLTLVLFVESEGDSYGVFFDSKDSYADHPRLVIEYESLIQELPEASFVYTPFEPKVNDTITFDSSDSIDVDGSIIGYLWDFGDGGTSTDKNPIHTYDQEGSYTVTLTVTDDDGLTDTLTVTITDVIIPEFSSYCLLLILLTVVTFAGVIYKRKLRTHL